MGDKRQSWEAECADLLLAGRKVDAVKLCRNLTGVWLKDALDMCNALEKRLAHGQEVSDTPRTEKATHGFVEQYGRDLWDIACVDEHFAQQLERELNAALERAQKAEQRCAELTDVLAAIASPSDPHHFGWWTEKARAAIGVVIHFSKDAK